MNSGMGVASILVLGLSVVTGAAEQVVGTLPVDPVELVQGREVPGDEDISVEHYRFRYVFANSAKKAEFVRNPEKYEIELGGACDRMGPLSGTGRPDIHAVHDGRIYIFASISCMETFKGGAAKLLESPDSAPKGDDVAKAHGRAIIDAVVAAMGGAERVAPEI